MEDTKKKVFIVVAILVVVGIVGYLLLSNQQVKESLQPQEQQEGENMTEAPEEMNEEAAKETENLIEEAQQKAQEQGTSTRNEVTWQEEEGEGTSTKSKTGVRMAEGGSPIDTQTGKVVTEEGEEADNAATPGSPEAPTQSFTTSEEDLPESTVKMQITQSSIDPAEFSVSPGQAVSISVTAAGDATEIFRFDEPSLEAVAVGVAPGKTRAITFNAPTDTGDYTYYSDVANHRALGAKGVMIVE